MHTLGNQIRFVGDYNCGAKCSALRSVISLFKNQQVLLVRNAIFNGGLIKTDRRFVKSFGG